MNEMSEFWSLVKKDSRRRKQNNLNSFNLTYWIKRNDYQYFKKINGKTFTYYPSTNCLVFKNKSYKGIRVDFLSTKCKKLLESVK